MSADCRRLVVVCHWNVRKIKISLNWFARAMFKWIKTGAKNCLDRKKNWGLPSEVKSEPGDWRHQLASYLIVALDQALIWQLSMPPPPPPGIPANAIWLENIIDRLARSTTRFHCCWLTQIVSDRNSTLFSPVEQMGEQASSVVSESEEKEQKNSQTDRQTADRLNQLAWLRFSLTITILAICHAV